MTITVNTVVMREYLDASGAMFASYYTNKSGYSWETPMDCLAEVIRVWSKPNPFANPRSRAFRERCNNILGQLGF